MTNSPPPNRDPSQRTPLGFDEFIGILVAFGTIGAILLGSLARKSDDLSLISSIVPSPTPTAQSTPIPVPQVTAKPTSVLPTPTAAPTEGPTDYSTEEQTTVLTPVPVFPSKSSKFADVPNDFWAHPFIEGLAARGVVLSQDSSFRPNEPITRAEFATWLQGAFQLAPRGITQDFKDITSNLKKQEIDSTTQTGFFKGYPGNIFRPEQPIPRVQVLVALVSGLKLAPQSSPTQILQRYQDVTQIPDYATEKIATATTAGLVVSHPDLKSLNPNQNATRAEVAAMTYQALVQSGRAESFPSPYIVQAR
jgi:hypothetical protein